MPCSFSTASEWFNLNDVDLEYIRFWNGGQDALISPAYGLPGRSAKENFNLSVDMSMLKWGFMDNTIHVTSDKVDENGASQVRTAGLEMRMGIRPFPFIEGFVYHHSQHWFDHDSGNRFPVLDGIGIKLRLLR